MYATVTVWSHQTRLYHPTSSFMQPHSNMYHDGKISIRGGTYQCPGYKHHGRYGIEIWRKEIHHDLHRQSCKSQQVWWCYQTTGRDVRTKPRECYPEGNIIGKTSFITTVSAMCWAATACNPSANRLWRGPVTVTHRTSSVISWLFQKLCRLVLEAAFMGQGNDIFIFDMGKPVKITDMACRMIKLAGLQPDKDIEIVYTGLRPGEKLYEELLYNEENSTPTLNPKIFKGISLKQDYDKISPPCNNWLRLPRRTIKETVYQLKQIVPEFKIMNSVYETLDEKHIYPKKWNPI